MKERDAASWLAAHAEIFRRKRSLNAAFVQARQEMLQYSIHVLSTAKTIG